MPAKMPSVRNPGDTFWMRTKLEIMQAGRDQQHERHGDLARSAAPLRKRLLPAVRGRVAVGILERIVDRMHRRLQRRHDADDEPDQDRDAEREREHRRIERDVVCARNESLPTLTSSCRLERREHESEQAAGERQQQAFGRGTA